MNLKVKSNGINFNVPTIENLPTERLEEDLVCVVTDENRGGVFVYREANALVNNGGTIFNGWTRQYYGAVNVKWFGAKGDGITDDTTSFVNALAYTKNIYAPEGAYILDNLLVDRANIIGDGNRNTIFKAKAGASSVLTLSNNGDWLFSSLEKVQINGNLKNSNGITFGNRSDGLDGRWTLRDVFITQVDKAIYKPRGNIGNYFERVTVSNANFGLYAKGQTSPIMHAGCDTYEACHFGDGIDIASWYIDNNDTDGYGQTVLRNCIADGNGGASVIIKNTGNLYQGVVIDNLWLEGNTQGGSITIDGVSHLTADYIFVNSKNISITNSYFKSYRLTDSSVNLNNCRVDNLAGYYIAEKDSLSYIQSINQCSVYAYADTNIFVKSIATKILKRTSISNFRASVYYCKDNQSFVKRPLNKILTRSFSGTTPFVLGGTTNIESVQVNEGNLYQQCARFSVPANNTNVFASVDVFENKYYVLSFSCKGSDVSVNCDINASAISVITPTTEFKTYKSIFHTGSTTTVINAAIVAGSAIGSFTIREVQVVSFDNLYEAMDFINSTSFVEA